MCKSGEVLRLQITDNCIIHRAGLVLFGADLARKSWRSRFVGRHELRRPRQSGQWHGIESDPAIVETGLSVAINKALHVLWRAPHETLSHSFASLPSPRGSATAVIMVILPALSISIRAISTP